MSKTTNSTKMIAKKAFRCVMAAAMVAGSCTVPQVTRAEFVNAVEAAQNTISSMDYFSPNDGPILVNSGVEAESYGFVMPIFNGGASTWQDVGNDLVVNVKVNGQWVNIDQVSGFAYNTNWGHWTDSGISGYWFKVDKTTNLQLASVSNPNVTLEYTLQFTKLSETKITSLAPTQGPTLKAGATGSVGFTYPEFNGDASVKYSQVAHDLTALVWSDEKNEWVSINNNASSGWIYDDNFGQFTDGPGGYWFTINKTTKVRLQSISNPSVHVDYTLVYEEPVRTAYKVSATETTYKAGKNGEIGLPLPMLDGGYPVSSEIGNFVYQIYRDGAWVDLSNFSKSTFVYQTNGYSKLSDKNQWGYWVDGIYGLWFQPIQEDMKIRIGYPENGQNGGSVGNNFVEYTFIGNPDAYRPDVSDLGNIEIGTSTNSTLADWTLAWSDEFNGNKLDTSKWNYTTGHYINDDPNTWGWGNAELEYYTTDEKNVYVKDGNLNITAYAEPTTFPEIDPNHVVPYSSGRINTKDKVTMKYGRIDFRAKLPEGDGLWPALWLLPNNDVYGQWAYSGEIDVCEVRGRVPEVTTCAAHFGGSWPTNTSLGESYTLPNGGSTSTDFHVYSVVWEEDSMKWYCDGVCFYKITSDDWYSLNAPNNNRAPFDQEFYVIINLALGGYFDSLTEPNAKDIPATLQVDYVRIYQSKDGTGEVVVTPGSGNDPVVTPAPTTPTPTPNPVTPTPTPGQTTIVNKVGDETKGLVRTDDTVEFYVNHAAFADVHYSINGGGQINVGMKNDGNGNFTFKVTGLNIGDTIEYFFTYNPGNGALDTARESFTLPATSSNTAGGSTSGNTGNQGNQGSTGGSATGSQGNDVTGVVQTGDTLKFYVNGAKFADLHFNVNKTGQANVSMKNDGNGNFTYTVSGLSKGDVVEYFFTYNPANGALDTSRESYTVK